MGTMNAVDKENSLRDEVIRAERELIRQRRKNAGFTNVDSDATAEPAADKKNSALTRNGVKEADAAPLADLVGVCLSGGGLRSAAFNLGILQGLHRYGVLRWVDYLASVSGGSYVSGMMAHIVSTEHRFGRESFGLANHSDGRDSERVAVLRQNGNYLARLDLFAPRYFAGLILNLIPRVSLLIALGALVAFLWRVLDYETVHDHFVALGFRRDAVPPLVPFFLSFIAWNVLLVLAIFLESPRLRTWANRAFVGCVAALCIGAVVLIGNGDITWRMGATEEGTTWQKNLRIPMIVATLLGLVPLIVPKAVIRSGLAPRWLVESWCFYYTSFPPSSVSLCSWWGYSRVKMSPGTRTIVGRS
jgi:hypothetical protein